MLTRKISENEKQTGEVSVSKYTMPGSFHLHIEDVQPATDEEKQQKVQMRESVTYWKDAIRRFRKNKVAMVSLVVIILITLFAVVGPWIVPYSFEQQIRGSEYVAPCLEHPFGTDMLGRDMLVRTMIGTRISLLIGLFCAIIVLFIGTVYGAVSGYLGGRVDNLMMRFCEVLYSVPDLLIIILLQLTLKPWLNEAFPNFQAGSGIISIFLTFALLYWVSMARMVRGQMLLLKQQEYVLAAKALGASGGRIIRKHLLPNASGTILVTTMFQIPTAIFTESFLSFIGLGVSSPMASLGSLSSNALTALNTYPYLILFPSIMIALIILAFNQLSDGLRDALDPRLRN